MAADRWPDNSVWEVHSDPKQNRAPRPAFHACEPRKRHPTPFFKGMFYGAAYILGIWGVCVALFWIASGQ